MAQGIERSPGRKKQIGGASGEEEEKKQRNGPGDYSGWGF